MYPKVTTQPVAPPNAELPKPAQNPVVRVLGKWLEPRSKNRDEAFRERTTRITVAILIVVFTVSLVASRLLFKSEWTLISFPSVIVVSLVLSIASGIAVPRPQVRG